MDTDRDRYGRQGTYGESYGQGQGQSQDWRGQGQGQEWRHQGQQGWNQPWNQGYGQYGSSYGQGNYTYGEGPYGNYGPGYYGYGQQGYGQQGYGQQGWNQPWNQSWNQGWRGQGYGQGAGQGYGESIWGRSGYTPVNYGNQYGSNQRGRFSGVGPQGYQRSDHRIQEDINDRMTEHPHLDARNISAQVHNGEVTLTGTVNSRQDKRMAEDIADSVSGVHDVHNNLKVQQQESLIDKIQDVFTPGSQSQQNQPTGTRR
jgi:hypothetical protein